MLSLLLGPALSLPVPVLPDPPAKDEVGPPGLVALNGGTTTVGSDPKEIQVLLDQSAQAGQLVRALDAETPQQRLRLEPFLIGVSEVTNEQYAQFVRATAHRPPLEWGREAIAKATQEFLVEQGKLREAARKEGKPVPERKEFDEPRWWDANWPKVEWKIPKGQELVPASYVSYADALAYCKWAGVRLQTEFEYQHACRGTGTAPFPWGEEWENAKFALTAEARRDKPAKAGSFEAGNSAEGLVDLSGNVWEWTSSPYVPYEKFKKNKYKIDGKREFQPEPVWDANQRVAVGGSFQNTRLAARCTTRRPTDRTQMTNALGFRVAATPRAGIDVAIAIYDDDVRNSEARPSGVNYMPDRAIAMDRWDAAEGAEGAPANYGVIAGYEHAIFVPIEQIDDNADSSFRRTTLTAPQHLGFLSLSFPILEPELPAGTYLIAFRAQGESRPAEGEEQVDEEGKPLPFEDPFAGLIDLEKDNLLIYDARSSALVAHLPIEGISFGKGQGGGKFERFAKKIQVPDPEKEGKTKVVEEPWVRLAVEIPAKVRNVALPFALEMKPEASFFEKEWRQ